MGVKRIESKSAGKPRSGLDRSGRLRIGEENDIGRKRGQTKVGQQGLDITEGL